MTFLHASLLLGGLLGLVPVVIHMLGRRQPKAIVFPAIRFVRQTAIQAQRGWSIKRWLLLALRVMLLGILAFAIASPRVQSGMFATYLMIGVVGLLALLATAVAVDTCSGCWALNTWWMAGRHGWWHRSLPGISKGKGAFGHIWAGLFPGDYQKTVILMLTGAYNWRVATR